MNYDYERQKRVNMLLQRRLGMNSSGGYRGPVSSSISVGGNASGFGGRNRSPNSLNPVNSTDVLEALRRGLVPQSLMGTNGMGAGASPGFGSPTGQGELSSALSQFRAQTGGGTEPVGSATTSSPDDNWSQSRSPAYQATGQMLAEGETPTANQLQRLLINRDYLFGLDAYSAL